MAMGRVSNACSWLKYIPPYVCIWILADVADRTGARESARTGLIIDKLNFLL